jgi:glutamine amidotransferase-like uncharacterized protein
MKFKPFTSGRFDISGIVPDGWVEKGPCEFLRGASDTDRTALVLQGVPGLTIEQIKALLLPQLDLREFPESTGSIKTANFFWDLYAIERQEPDIGTVMVDVALTQASAWTYIVLLQAMPDEYDDLHYGVFLRAVDALAPTSADEVEKRAQEHQKVDREAEADVILVKGERLENHACEVVADILRTGLGLSTEFVDLEALGEVDFHGVRLIFFPGGECGLIRLSERASRQVQTAVASGTGYIGTCCGAFLAAEAVTTASHIYLKGDSFPFCIFPGLAEWGGGEGVWPFYIDVRHPIVSNASVADSISPVMRMKFVGGTSNLVPSYERRLQNWCVATLDKPPNRRPVGRRAAMTATVFGKGRVFLSGPHPEAQEDTHSLILAAAEWCTHQSDPASDRCPSMKAAIPAEGVANHSFVCSATDAHDPYGFPVGFIWDFGDASPKQYRPEAMHVYKEPGSYTITLTVTTGIRHSTQSTEVRIREV